MIETRCDNCGIAVYARERSEERIPTILEAMAVAVRNRDGKELVVPICPACLKIMIEEKNKKRKG